MKIKLRKSNKVTRAKIENYYIDNEKGAELDVATGVTVEDAKLGVAIRLTVEDDWLLLPISSLEFIG